MKLTILNYSKFAKEPLLRFSFIDSKMKGDKRLTIVIKLGTKRWRLANSMLTIRLRQGSSSIVDEETHQPRLSVVTLIVETAVRLRKDGHRVVIVSSGAIAVGLQRMGIDKKPKHLPRIQVRLR